MLEKKLTLAQRTLIEENYDNKDFDGLLYIGRSVRISKKKLQQYIQNHLQYKL